MTAFLFNKLGPGIELVCHCMQYFSLSRPCKVRITGNKLDALNYAVIYAVQLSMWVMRRKLLTRVGPEQIGIVIGSASVDRNGGMCMKFFRLEAGVCLRVLAAGMCVLLMSLPLFSQGSAGRILGSITDQSGGVLAGASVTVLDVQRGITRTLIADQSGEYVAPSLLPGTYTVRVEFKGFKTVERQKIVLEVNQDIRVDLSLEPGEQTQTITVTEQLPLIETTNATLGGTLSNETINELPMMGRSYQNLLTLRPGMMIYPGGGGWTMSTNGSRPEENQFILDGLTNDNPLQGLTIINGPGVAGDAATIMPVDAIQEVKIEENPKAEYGGKPGAVVNVGIKSGTNSIHGTAYAFGRDSAMDARNYFDDTSLPKRAVALEQYGATVGGPIKKINCFSFLGTRRKVIALGICFLRPYLRRFHKCPLQGLPIQRIVLWMPSKPL